MPQTVAVGRSISCYNQWAMGCPLWNAQLTPERVTLITPGEPVVGTQELHLYRVVIPPELQQDGGRASSGSM